METQRKRKKKRHNTNQMLKTIPPPLPIRMITGNRTALRQRSVTTCLEHKNRGCPKNPMFFKKVTLKEITRKGVFIPVCPPGDIEENFLLCVATCNQTFSSAE